MVGERGEARIGDVENGVRVKRVDWQRKVERLWERGVKRLVRYSMVNELVAVGMVRLERSVVIVDATYGRCLSCSR